MKKAALWVSCAFIIVGAVGCKNDLEKATDAVCACVDKKGADAKKCMDDAEKDFKDKMPKGSMDEYMKTASDKDKETAKKFMDCALKAGTEADKAGSK